MTQVESSIELESPVVRTLKVSVGADRCRQAIDKAFAELGRKAHLKGFRKGKVPRKVLEQHYGESVQRDVVSDLIEEVAGELIREHDLDVVAAPRLLSQGYDSTAGLSFELQLETRPEFDLPEYKDRTATMEIVRVADEDVAAAVESLRERMAMLVTVEDRREVVEGDVVTFDMYGFDEAGEAVQGTSGQGVQLEVGGGRFPEDFEKGLAGCRIKEKSSVSVAFAEDHADEDLRGRTVRFDVTVTEIKRKVLPELDDEFAAELGVEGCDTLEALQARVREDLQARARSDAERGMRDALIGALVEELEFDVPSSLVESSLHSYLHELGAAHGPEDKVAELEEALRPQAVKQVRARFLLDAIARAEQIDVAREEIEERVRRQLAGAGKDAERVREHYSRPGAVADLAASLAREKAVAKVVESARITEREMDRSEVADRG
jgi:trigger factor